MPSDTDHPIEHTKIHPTAIVEDGAQLGAGCTVHAHAIITRYCVLGDRVVVHPFAVLGGPPQDLSAEPLVNSSLRVGSGTVVREHVTLNRGSRPGGVTEIGADCFIMAAAHVAHDCRIGDRVVIANAVLLGGHVHVGNHTFIGGGAVVHQHGRIGESTMIGGGSRISEDVAPYCMAAERNRIVGLNVVGLRRRGLARESFNEIKRAYREVNRSSENPRRLAALALASGQFASVEAKRFLEFFQGGTRRFARPREANDSASGDSATD